jgi:hypothetical protein
MVDRTASRPGCSRRSLTWSPDFTLRVNSHAPLFGQTTLVRVIGDALT